MCTENKQTNKQTNKMFLIPQLKACLVGLQMAYLSEHCQGWDHPEIQYNESATIQGAATYKQSYYQV
jgi:hypothetical protein